MIEYIKEGRIKIDKTKFAGKLTTIHDPCNYCRKSEKTFGKGYYDEIRWITNQICDEVVETTPTRENNFCCGGGGGAWALPYSKERIYYGRKKAEQIKETEAELVVAPCHNCRDQIMKSLTKEYELPIETFYLWELLAEAIIIEPWSEEEIEKAHAEAKAQWDEFGIEEEEEEDWQPPE
jgi:Fe-S oxidoreductase